mgnify:FL=1
MFQIAEMRRRHGLTAMVETGTYKGASVFAALEAGYEKVLTCEATPLFVDNLRPHVDARVTMFAEPSATALPKMLDLAVDDRVLFWLDAHCDPLRCWDWRAPAMPGLDVLPLPRELALIRARRGDAERDAFIIDDLNLYVRQFWVGGEWAALWGLGPPAFETVRDLIDLLPRHDCHVEHGALVAVPMAPR